MDAPLSGAAAASQLTLVTPAQKPRTMTQQAAQQSAQTTPDLLRCQAASTLGAGFECMHVMWE